MTEHTSQTVHSAAEEMIAAHAADTLSNSQHLLLSCQAELQPDIARRIESYDAVGGALIESAKAEDLSDAFFSHLMDALDDSDEAPEAPLAESDLPNWMPEALADYLQREKIDLKWRTVGPGVQHAAIATSPSGERLYLLRAAPGIKMPVHSHAGEEWTLVLQGGYHVGETGYVRGDLHCEDASCEHQPIIDDHGEACISLVVDQGRLKFRNWALSMIQVFTRI